MQEDVAGFALRVGLLIDGKGGEPVSDAIVQVADGRVVAAGRAEDFGAAAADALDKLVASGGGTRGGIPYLAAYTVDELRVGVEAAHALERPTVAHARATQSIENADLLLLRGNPLEDEQKLRCVAAVYKSGVRVV